MLTSHGRDGVLIMAGAGPGDFPEAPKISLLLRHWKGSLRAFLETSQRSGRPLLGEARRKPKVPGRRCSRRAKVSQSLPRDLLKRLGEARRRAVDKNDVLKAVRRR